MRVRSVNLTDELDRFISKKVKSGRYRDASEVVSAALRAFENTEDEIKLAALRQAIAEGDASGIADGDVMGEILERLKSHSANR